MIKEAYGSKEKLRVTTNTWTAGEEGKEREVSVKFIILRIYETRFETRMSAVQRALVETARIL